MPVPRGVEAEASALCVVTEVWPESRASRPFMVGQTPDHLDRAPGQPVALLRGPPPYTYGADHPNITNLRQFTDPMAAEHMFGV